VHEGLGHTLRLGPLRLVAIAYYLTQARSWHPGATISISPPNQLSANQFLVAFPVTSPFLPNFDHPERADVIEALDKVEDLQADVVVLASHERSGSVPTHAAEAEDESRSFVCHPA
jgi:hypothetical protein